MRGKEEPFPVDLITSESFRQEGKSGTLGPRRVCVYGEGTGGGERV